MSAELLRQKGRSEVSWNEILNELVGLSYGGDIRMLLGVEQSDKINAIVSGQYDKLTEIYGPIASKLGMTKGSQALKIDDMELRLPIRDRLGKDMRGDIRSAVSAINRRTSLKMAMSQFVAGHPLKNVS